MSQSIQQIKILSPRSFINWVPVRRGSLLIALALTWFALSPTVRAQDAGETDANGNTAMEGSSALISLSTGVGNTGLGFDALLFNASGDDNTATGSNALLNNTSGSQNTATGRSALFSNTTADNNTADGFRALKANTTGTQNTASGFQALLSNTNGANNTATGAFALGSNVGGGNNTASGVVSLVNNTSGSSNTAIGIESLESNTNGNNNLACGASALISNTSGSNNTALGVNAGLNLTTGSNNIDIGNAGKAGESNTIRIGTKGMQTSTFIAGISGAGVSGAQVLVNSSGKLGVATSSARFKHEIKPMEKASEAILALKPVTFRYKEEIDPEKMPQFGLVAEEVEKIAPDLVTRDEQDKPYGVRYEAVNAMLLNEFLKAHRTLATQQHQVEEQNERLAKQDFLIAQQQKQIEALTTGLQKITAEVKTGQGNATRVAGGQYVIMR